MMTPIKLSSCGLVRDHAIFHLYIHVALSKKNQANEKGSTKSKLKFVRVHVCMRVLCVCICVCRKLDLEYGTCAFITKTLPAVLKTQTLEK